MPFILSAEATVLTLLLSAEGIVAILVSTQLGHRQRSAWLTSPATYGAEELVRHKEAVYCERVWGLGKSMACSV